MLDILIAHYREPLEYVDRLLTSINNQNIDFNLINVYLYNDGDEVVFNNLPKYKFDINYKIVKHCGTSKIRNKLLKDSKDKYFWYIDSDDYIYDGALQKILPLLSLDLDLISVGCIREHKNYDTFYCPQFTNYSIVGCNIFKRKFILKNKLYCDESVKLAGDVFIETMPKWYTRNRVALSDKILHYTYNVDSVVHQKKNNGWADEVLVVISHCIDRLIKEHRVKDAYKEYLNYILAYNNKYIHDKYKQFFIDKGIYDLTYALDLR